MAIEKAPSKNWELTLYEMQRTPQPLITDDSEIAICPLRLSNELKCPICLDFLNNTMATKECLHRFCSQCIVTALRSGNKECPACRKKLVSKRSLRHDPNFDAIIAKLFPYRKEYEAHQASVMAKQIKQSINKSIKSDGGGGAVGESVGGREGEQQESNNEAESGSSKEQSSTASLCVAPKYRATASRCLERVSLALPVAADMGSAVSQCQEEFSSVLCGPETVVPQKRLRHPSSESGDHGTNGSSSITSELCSIIDTQQSRDDESQSNIVIGEKTQSYTFSDNPIDIVLEPLDGRTSKTKLNETYILQIPDVTTAGHLVEFLSIRRSEMLKNKRLSINDNGESTFSKGFKSRQIVDDVTYNIFLAMTSNEKKSNNNNSNSLSTDPNRQSTSSAVKTVRKSMNTKLDASDNLNNVISGFNHRKKKNKKEKMKQALSGCEEFLVFYYQEVSHKALHHHLHMDT